MTQFLGKSFEHSITRSSFWLDFQPSIITHAKWSINRHQTWREEKRKKKLARTLHYGRTEMKMDMKDTKVNFESIYISFTDTHLYCVWPPLAFHSIACSLAYMSRTGNQYNRYLQLTSPLHTRTVSYLYFCWDLGGFWILCMCLDI